MATLAEMKANPGDYLGASNDPAADQKAYRFYFETVERLDEIYASLTDDIAEGENPETYGIYYTDPIDIAFGDGDYCARCEEIAAMTDGQIIDAWFRC